MEDQSSLLNLTYFNQAKSMDELRQSHMLIMELQDTKLKAQEDLRIRDGQIAQLKELLDMAFNERDEAQEKCQKVILQKLLLQKPIRESTPNSVISSAEDDHTRGLDSNHGFSSSDCEESIVSSPHQRPAEAADVPVPLDRPLPEKGRLLQAVMKSGPLLQTLLLTGPLPKWHHPPPPLDTYQIPTMPMMIPSPATQSVGRDPFQSMINLNNCGRIRKIGFCEGSDSFPSKYQRVSYSALSN